MSKYAEKFRLQSFVLMVRFEYCGQFIFLVLRVLVSRTLKEYLTHRGAKIRLFQESNKKGEGEVKRGKE